MSKSKVIQLVILLATSFILLIIGISIRYQIDKNQTEINSSHEVLNNILGSATILDEAIHLYTVEEYFLKSRINQSIAWQLSLLNQSLDTWNNSQFDEIAPQSHVEDWGNIQDSLRKAVKKLSLSSNIIILNQKENALDQLEIGAAIKTAKRDIDHISSILESMKIRIGEYDQYWKLISLITWIGIVLVVLGSWLALVFIFIRPLHLDNIKTEERLENIKREFDVKENKYNSIATQYNTSSEQLRDTQRLLRVANNSLSSKGKDLTKLKQDFEIFVNLIHYELTKPSKSLNLISHRMVSEIKSQDLSLLSQSVELVSNKSQRMIELIDGLRKIGSDLISDTENQSVYLNPLISEICIKASIHENIDLHVQQDLPVLETKKKPLETILFALIDNANKFNTSSKPEIKISAEEKNEFIWFEITDNGDPIPEENRSIIFNIFQVKTSTNSHSGLGLGLTLAKYLVERFGGTIELNSSADGNTFRFSWPINM